MRHSLLLAIPAFLVFAGCGQAATTTVAAHETAHHTTSRLFCMRGIADLEVREIDLHDGAEMAFMAPEASDRSELRALIERFVALDEQARTESPDAPHFAAPEALIHHAHLSAVETPNGVRLLAETRNEDIDAVRAELREDARELVAEQCPLAMQLVL